MKGRERRLKHDREQMNWQWMEVDKVSGKIVWPEIYIKINPVSNSTIFLFWGFMSPHLVHLQNKEKYVVRSIRSNQWDKEFQ